MVKTNPKTNIKSEKTNKKMHKLPTLFIIELQSF